MAFILFALWMQCSLYTAGFTCRKKASLMRMHWRKLYANLKMFAGLHLGYFPLYSAVIVCLTVASKPELGKSLIWISKPSNGKCGHGKWTERTLPFHQPLPVGKAFHLWQLQHSKAVTNRRLRLWLCTGFVLPTTLSPNRCCKSQSFALRGASNTELW